MIKKTHFEKNGPYGVFALDGSSPLLLVRQTFFNALKERIAFGVKKRRLPNNVTTFVRTDAPPLGSFTKYSWYITNILHVKSIFDGPEVRTERAGREGGGLHCGMLESALFQWC